MNIKEMYFYLREWEQKTDKHIYIEMVEHRNGSTSISSPIRMRAVLANSFVVQIGSKPTKNIQILNMKSTEITQIEKSRHENYVLYWGVFS